MGAITDKLKAKRQRLTKSTPTKRAATVKKAKPAPITLTPGKFYRARDGAIWCCYRLNQRRDAAQHAAAWCIDIETSTTEYFYLNGAYSTVVKGHDRDLVEECVYSRE